MSGVNHFSPYGSTHGTRAALAAAQNARLIGAQEACDVHVVNKSVPRARVLPEAIEMATRASSYNSDIVMDACGKEGVEEYGCKIA